MLLFVHVYVTDTVGEKSARTLAVSIDRLKFTNTAALTGTSAVAFAGFVSVITGATQNVVKFHGFGAGPETRASPSVSRPEMVNMYRVQSLKSVEWLRVSVVFPLDHE